MKIAVLGAGISGLTVAHKLKEKGLDVTIYEKCVQPGGLAKSRVVNKYIYDPHGGHIFNSKYSEIVEWVFSILSKDNWQYTVRNAKIFFDGKYISYPFELSLCELETEDAVECVHDFVLSQCGSEPGNFYDWLTWNFGDGIANRYMIPYNEKIWAYPLKKMEVNWMQGKMPLPSKKEIIKSILLKDPSERKMPHSTFYYPIEGGIQTMVNAIVKNLTIKCNEPVIKLERNKLWYVNGEGGYNHIISTIPLPKLAKVMNLPHQIQDAISDLKYNSLTTMLFKCPDTDISWLYIPSREYRSHRVGYQSALTPKATPSGGSGALEIIGPKFNFSDNVLITENIVPHELGFQEMIDSEFTEYAYVIHDTNYRRNTKIIHDYFENLDNFDLLGRFAEWNYNNMDICMLEAFKLAEKIN